MATNMNTNDLYQMIADNKAQADNVAQLAAGTPTFQENFGSTLRTQDKTLSSAVNNYGDAVAQLFAHDQSLASQVGGADTGIAPEGFVEDPYSRAMASANLYAEKGNMVASQLKTLESRKALLGDIVDKAVLMYKSAVEGKQLDYQANRDALSDALDVMKFEETKRSNLASEEISRASALGSSLTGVDAIDFMSDADAVAKIKDVFGPNIDLGAVQKERGARAKLLLAKLYNGEQVDYRDLLTPADVVKLDEATASLQGADRALATFNKYGGKSGWGGTGPFIGKVNEGTLQGALLLGEKERDLRRAVIDVSSAYQKFLSGVAVSAQEMVRLEGLLPSQKKPENANVDDLTRLKRGMEINLELDKRAKLYKLSPDQAYKKFGPEVFAQYGEVFPGSTKPSLDSLLIK